MVDPLRYYTFQAILHNWCNTDQNRFYPVCGMADTTDPKLNRKSRHEVVSVGFSGL